MDEKQFKVGDAVQLKSGGPGMTIVSPGMLADGTEAWNCKWYDGKQPVMDWFPDAALIRYEKPKITSRTITK